MTSTRMTPQELAELDLAVARVEGMPNPRLLKKTTFHESGCFIEREAWSNGDVVKYKHDQRYQPTRDAQEAGRLLVKYNLSLIAPILGNKYWYANWGLAQEAAGETPWIAACNAVVALGGRK